ncbi:MAG TPA: SDR family oxidoreductase [Casimicrobiaceae bacterium]|nr:SDR family oxidoreductase [Casimicrobiaceae bacterium]
MIRVLVVGCGDVAMRAARILGGRARLVGLTRRADETAKLREHRIVPILGDLDDLRTLARLRAAPDAVLHFAPPPPEGRGDPRTGRLVAALSAARRIPRRFVYVSTTGVYGDCAGARVAETRPRHAQSPRARRRVDAEDRLRAWAARNGVSLSILRAPGIYAQTRLPLERLRQGTPVLVPEHDVYTNHIHADDLARSAVAALFRARPNRAYHASDDSELRMGQWFDALADAHRLPRPPRVDWEEAETRIAPVLLSFMNESRRLSNDRLKRELRVRLAYATPQAMLDASAARDPKRQLPLAF